MSSSKRGRSLAEVMAPLEDEAPGAPPAPAPRTAAAEPAAPPPPPPAPAPEPVSIVPLNILVTPEDRKRLRQLSLDSNLSLQKLGHEAWNLLLQKRGLPPLKPVAANVPSGRLRGR
jgi:hypothetical protein